MKSKVIVAGLLMALSGTSVYATNDGKITDLSRSVDAFIASGDTTTNSSTFTSSTPVTTTPLASDMTTSTSHQVLSNTQASNSFPTPIPSLELSDAEKADREKILKHLDSSFEKMVKKIEKFDSGMKKEIASLPKEKQEAVKAGQEAWKDALKNRWTRTGGRVDILEDRQPQ